MAKKITANSDSSQLTHLIGSWAFFIGLVIVALAGLGFAESAVAYAGLGLLGLIVGLLNIREHQEVPFLVASIALVTAGTGLGSVLANVPSLGSGLLHVLHYLVVFIAPAAVVVALKTIYEIGRSP